MSNGIIDQPLSSEEVAFEELIEHLEDCAMTAREHLDPRTVFNVFVGSAMEVGLETNDPSTVFAWLDELAQVLKSRLPF